MEDSNMNFTLKKPSRPPPPPPPHTRPMHAPSPSWTGPTKISSHLNNGCSTMSHLTSSMRLRNEKPLPAPPSYPLKKSTNGSVMNEESSKVYIPISECTTGPPPIPEKPSKFSMKEQLKILDTPGLASDTTSLTLNSSRHQDYRQMQPNFYATNSRKTLSVSIASVPPANQCSETPLHHKSQSCGVDSSQRVQYLEVYIDPGKLSLNEKMDNLPKKPLPRIVSPPSPESTVYRQVDFVRTQALTKCKVERTLAG